MICLILRLSCGEECLSLAKKHPAVQNLIAHLFIFVFVRRCSVDRAVRERFVGLARTRYLIDGAPITSSNNNTTDSQYEHAKDQKPIGNRRRLLTTLSTAAINTNAVCVSTTG